MNYGDATGDRTATIYQFACGSVAFFAPDAPPSHFRLNHRSRLPTTERCNDLPDFVAHNFAIMTVSLITLERV